MADAVFCHGPANKRRPINSGRFAMLIALLAVLGVDLIVIVGVLAAVVGRRRWVSHHAGSFPGAAHVVDGDVYQLGRRARRGYGRWVGNVLVWTPAPLYLRNAIVAVNSIGNPRDPAGTVRRLGKTPRTITVNADGARIDITVRSEDLAKATVPFPAEPLAPDPAG